MYSKRSSWAFSGGKGIYQQLQAGVFSPSNVRHEFYAGSNRAPKAFAFLVARCTWKEGRCSGFRWFLSLAGTAKHLIGAGPTKEVQAPYSEMAGIVTLVSKSVIQHFNGAEYWPRDRAVSKDVVWLRDLINYIDDRGQPSQDISFIARRLVSKSHEGEHLVLASPLYVELPTRT